MKTYKIAVIAGDGIGKEVIPAGMQVLNMAAEQDGFRCDFTELPWGCDFYLKTGRMIDPDGVEQMMKFASEQIYTVRQYAETHRGEPLAKKIGLSWQPQNRFMLPSAQFEAEVELQAARLAEAFRWSYGPGSTPEGACVAPGTVVDWCTSERAGALFVETWPAFRSWK